MPSKSINYEMKVVYKVHQQQFCLCSPEEVFGLRGPLCVALERTAVAMTTVYIPPQDKVSAAVSHPKSRLNTMKCTDADIQ